MIRYERAGGDADMDQIHRLRSRVFQRERIKPLPGYPPGRERDPYDAYAVHILAWHSDFIPIGTVRLILRNQLGLPVEKYCRISAGRRGKSGEISQLAVSRIATKIAGVSQREVILGMLREIALESRSIGIHYAYLLLTRGMCRLLGSYGINLKPIGPAENYADLSPYVINLGEIPEPSA